MKKTRTTAYIYHPQSNGFIERFNRTLEAMLSMYAVNERQNDWDLNLKHVTLSYCSSTHETPLKFSPAEKSPYLWILYLGARLRDRHPSESTYVAQVQASLTAEIAKRASESQQRRHIIIIGRHGRPYH